MAFTNAANPRPDSTGAGRALLFVIVVLALLGLGFFATLRPESLKARVVYGEF